MDINLVVINVGNTRLGVGVFEAGELVYTTREHLTEPRRWEDALTIAWQRVDGKENAAVAGASVNPAAMEQVEHLASRISGKKVEWVGREIELPIRVLTDPPGETGVDRVITMAAAYEQM